MKTTITPGSSACCALVLALGTAGCGDGGEEAGTGSLSVLVEAEDVIIEGLEPGEDAENIKDGWTVSFDKYLVAIGDIDLHLATDESVTAEAADVFVVDLKALPAGGLPLWELTGLEAGRWEFSFSTPGAADGAERHQSASEDDFTAMQAGDFTYLVEGALAKSDGRSCPPASLAEPPSSATAVGTNDGGDSCYENPSIAFSLGATAETVFGPCEIDGVPGVSIPSGGTQTVAATIHGDHLFFNGFPEGDEGGTLRLAQWLADCDLDVDGVVTREELEAIAPAALPEIDDRYQLGGAPISPLTSMWDYVVAQLKTQGHFQGEGECPLDGLAHGHR